MVNSLYGSGLEPSGLVKETSEDEIDPSAAERKHDAPSGDSSAAGTSAANDDPFILSYGSEPSPRAGAGGRPLPGNRMAGASPPLRARHLKLKSEAEAGATQTEEAAPPPDELSESRSRKLVVGGGALLLVVLGTAAVMMGQRNDGSAPAVAVVDGRSLQGAGAARSAAPISAEIAAADAALSASAHQPPPMEPMPAIDERAFQVPSLGQIMADAGAAGPLPAAASVVGGDGMVASQPLPAAASPQASSEGQTSAPTVDVAPVPTVQPVAPAAASPAIAVATARPTPPPPRALASRQPPLVATPARWISGEIANSDNPYGRFEGTLSVSFLVGTDGSVTGCRPLVSSGKADLDAATCGLVERRLRFSPALDQQGQPVASEIRTSYSWGKKRRR